MSANADPASGAFAPSLDADFTGAPRGVYVGTTGNLVVTMSDGTVATFANVQGGTMLPIRVKRIQSSGTTASNIVVLT